MWQTDPVYGLRTFGRADSGADAGTGAAGAPGAGFGGVRGALNDGVVGAGAAGETWGCDIPPGADTPSRAVFRALQRAFTEGNEGCS